MATDERFQFNSATQKPSESVDEFYPRLRQLAESCEFGELKDSLIRERIVIGTTDDLGGERLLRSRPTPELDAVVESLRAAEVCRAHKQVITGKTETVVDHVRQNGNLRDTIGDARDKARCVQLLGDHNSPKIVTCHEVVASGAEVTQSTTEMNVRPATANVNNVTRSDITDTCRRNRRRST
jgi:hypothetical protein